LYSFSEIIILIKARMWARHVARMGRRGEGKGPLGGPRRRWEDNVRMDHEETGWSGIDRIHLAQDGDQRRALVNTVMNLRVP
jgi:hypothetical protein